MCNILCKISEPRHIERVLKCLIAFIEEGRDESIYSVLELSIRIHVLPLRKMLGVVVG